MPDLAPACLPVTEEFTADPVSALTGVRCLATGWGQTVFGGELEMELREVELTVRENKVCEMAYDEKYGIDIKVQDSVALKPIYVRIYHASLSVFPGLSPLRWAPRQPRKGNLRRKC